MNNSPEALTNKERPPVRFGFKMQAICIMLALLAIGVSTLSLLIERSVRESYKEIFAEQFATSAAQIRDLIKDNSDSNSNSISELSLNPRLIAALEIGASDNYERFFYDCIAALRGTVETQGSASFIALFDQDRTLHVPNKSETPLVLTYDAVQSEIIPQLLDTFEDALPDRDTLTALWSPSASKETLFVTTVNPVYNLFDEPVGHLIVGLPFSLEVPQNGRAAVFEILPGNLNQNKMETPWYVFQIALAQESPFSPATLSASFAPDEFEDLLTSIRVSILLFAAIALFIGLFISVASASSLTRPIETLVKASNEVSHGHFDTRIKKHRGDEWGHLTRAFNDMTEGLETREKYRAVLNKVADPSVAELLTEGRLELGGELRTATVLFCDIRGFTPMTQNMDPRAVIELLNEHMSALTEIVQAHGGVVDKFVGDEIMAIFGVPKEYGDDALSAVSCARTMLAKRSQLNDAEGNTRIDIGVGISTGPLVAGCMGSEDRLSYTVLGATVNLGARLCSKALPGTCLIDETTNQQLDGRESTDFYQEISVKGFTAPRPVFTLS